MSGKWDVRFIELAKHISLWSKDPSTKVGCVVVGEDREIRSTGFNGFHDILWVGLGVRLGSYGVHWHSLGFNDKISSTGAWASGWDPIECIGIQ